MEPIPQQLSMVEKLLKFFDLIIFFFFIIGTFLFTGFTFKINFGTKLNIFVTIDSLSSGIIDSLYNTSKFPNDVFLNKSYYFSIPVEMTKSCDQGQYFDSQQ